MIKLGILADDLTGGMMVASLLEREGVECPLVSSVDALADISPTATAVVVAAKYGWSMPPPPLRRHSKQYRHSYNWAASDFIIILRHL